MPQISRWGMVEGGHDVDRNFFRVQVNAACTLLRLLEFSFDIPALPSAEQPATAKP